MKISDLLKIENIDSKKSFLLGLIYAWPIFSNDSNYLLAYSGYRNGDRIDNVLSRDLNYYSNEHFKKMKFFLGDDYNLVENKNIKDTGIIFEKKILNFGVSIILINDIEKDLIYSKIEKWLIDANEENKKWFFIGFMEGRGSLDFSRNFYSIDIAHKDSPEIARRKLNRMNDIVGLVYNYNPRILQNNSDKKNDQFRIKLDYYSGNFGFFRPHIIEYYQKEKNIKLTTDNKNIIFIDSNNKNIDISSNLFRNLKINDLAISLKDIDEKEKYKKIQEYKINNFDFDTEDEILYSSFNTKESAKNKARYLCEIDNGHATFISKSSKQNYVEAHHLVPFSKRKSFDVNIDIEENLVALCPNCHRKIHLAVDNEKKNMLDKLFNLRNKSLTDASVKISKDDLYHFYGIKE